VMVVATTSQVLFTPSSTCPTHKRKFIRMLLFETPDIPTSN
jgi:hypothetical protein